MTINEFTETMPLFETQRFIRDYLDDTPRTLIELWEMMPDPRAVTWGDMRDALRDLRESGLAIRGRDGYIATVSDWSAA